MEAIGTTFLSAILDPLVPKLDSQEVLDFFRGQKLDVELLDKLKMELQSVNVVLDYAEAEQVARPEVKDWLDDLKDVVYQADDILDEIATEASKWKNRSRVDKSEVTKIKKFIATKVSKWKNGFRSRVHEFKVSKIKKYMATKVSKWRNGSRVDKFKVIKIKKIIEKLSDIASQLKRLGLKKIIGLEHKSPPRVQPDSLPESSVGREKEKQEADDILDEIATEASKWNNRSRVKKFIATKVSKWKNGFRSRVHKFKVSKIKKYMATKVSKWRNGPRVEKYKVTKIKKIIEKISYIASQQERLGLKKIIGREHKLPPRDLKDSLPESSVYGRDKEKEEILKLLLPGDDAESEDKISVIPIVGMGGLGKTTLARVLYNDDKVKESFELKAWVCVTEDMDILRITKTILESITSKSCDITDLTLLRSKLKEKLTGEKFLLVLDDVWKMEYAQWLNLLAPFSTASVESKIIVTTRLETVASVSL